MAVHGSTAQLPGPSQPLDGRRLYEAGAWSSALEAFERADSAEPLPGADLMLTAFSAYLLGLEDRSIALFGRAFRDFLGAHDDAAAARSAFWLGFAHDARGDRGRAEAWGRRLAAIVEEAGLSAERALLLSGMGHRALASPDPAETRRALGLSREAALIAHAARDTDTEVFSRLSTGWALLRLGSDAEGLAELDEAMATVTAGEVSTPIVNGVAYCSVISASLRAKDLSRAREWTSAATDWCARNQELVPFRGQCLVHRAEVKMLDGDWPGALEEAARAAERLLPADAGLASYQLGELHRLTGRFAEAEDAYRRANSAGRRPEPGLMLLRLAQGRVDVASTSARRLAAELTRRSEREDFLPAYVEVMAAAGDSEAACAGAEELSRLAEKAEGGRPGVGGVLTARALTAQGTARCAAGEAAQAVQTLREASLAWHRLGLPYLEARTRAVLGRCYAALGDNEAAALETDAARAAFGALGAAPDLAALPARTAGGGAVAAGGRAASSAGPLTEREVQVVRLVAAGLTNRGIAKELVLSEKTVARHLANVYAKLGIASRAAATAYAYDHGLL
ncbi:LuxR family transcriptional regulator [Sinomonas atrocyanea]|uniref:LuxR family transcriptional regulator n=1 Tax=Sinomonas atrocyanea TaxID=37927 RepID=A0A126ZY34_9MICC|nr:helix-turn-helix transcriptional regulator [Sinomonas atrocyanea]AMM31796.1 LuxR family transcriptional regulator [Sinomonas atrocyanea]GGG70370.1 helix-turn-helix transcriptional regulator [Sinomonas atrocyanea]